MVKALKGQNSNYGLATRHASFRAIRTFYRWLESEYNLDNPMVGLSAPILGKPILPVLEQKQVLYLIDMADHIRDKAIIALFTESGLRLSELVDITLNRIDWSSRIMRVVGKGRKEAYALFGQLSEKYLREWLNEFEPSDNIWGINVDFKRRLVFPVTLTPSGEPLPGC